MTNAKPIPPVPETWFATRRYAIEDRGYDSPCWIWQLGTSREGYAKAMIRSAQGSRNVCAHRVYYERAFGPIVDFAMEIDHRCEQRACVNPAHLELVTACVNSRRAHAKRRRLSPQAIRDIRSRSATQRSLAAKYDVAPGTIWAIWADRIYSEVE